MLLTCPSGSSQYGNINDEPGVGLAGQIRSLTHEACQQRCISDIRCAYFHYFPKGGLDGNPSTESACQLYPSIVTLSGPKYGINSIVCSRLNTQINVIRVFFFESQVWCHVRLEVFKLKKLTMMYLEACRLLGA